MKVLESVKHFLSALLGSPEQDRHDEILRKYTLPEHHTAPQHTVIRKAV
jgi:hypothetical protein